MQTLRVRQLVNEVLAGIPAPRTEDVIDEVFHAIEGNPLWRKTYDEIVYKVGKSTANAWTGFWIAHAEARVGDVPGPSARSSLIDSYSKLVGPAPKRGKKVTQADAQKLMHEHYLAHRETLPAAVREHRDLIVALVMSGIPVEAAFLQAFEKPMFAR